MASHNDSTPTVAIIGAGFGGVAAAIALKRQLGFKNFIVYEKSTDVGGTWRDNSYPGAASDLPIHLYSLSADLKDDWGNIRESQPAIYAYIKELVTKHALRPHIAFNSRVVAAEWQTHLQAYKITIEDTRSGARTTSIAEVILSAHGILHIPNIPPIPGLDSFKGLLFHSSQWDTSLDLSGKRVAVIGNGGSAAQIIPNILKLKNINVTQFFRTRCWYVPSGNKPISDGWKWAFRHIPFLNRLYRISIFLNFELLYLRMNSATIRSQGMKWATSYMLKTCPKKYHEQLIPSHPMGCRRVILNAGYLEALHRPNMSLRRDDIEAIVEDGIITKAGEKLPIDVIICATGFAIDTFPYTLRGTGPTIQQFYKEREGPEAYLGMVVPGFPNFYMLSGPNTITGYTSVIFCNEVQLEYIMKLIKPVIERSVSSFELTHKANREYNTKIQARFTNSVFTQCSSWYRLNKVGRVISIFPGSCVHFWWWCRRVNWSHYKVVAAQGVQWKPSTFKNTALVVSAYLIAFLALVVWQIGRA